VQRTKRRHQESRLVVVHPCKVCLSLLLLQVLALLGPMASLPAAPASVGVFLLFLFLFLSTTRKCPVKVASEG
jgi:hypothetical protein